MGLVTTAGYNFGVFFVVLFVMVSNMRQCVVLLERKTQYIARYGVTRWKVATCA